MNEKKKVKIIIECLNAVIQDLRSEKECLELYPELKPDLLDVFSVSHSLKKYQAPQFSPQRMRQSKDQLLFKLADRDEIVTKTSQFRYRLQNAKRRISMVWVIIVTTFLSLVSGAGVVYASNTALPGEILYPVKTWVEDVQIALSPDAVDVKFYEEFAGNRIEELIALADAGEIESIDELVDVYKNRNELMIALMTRIKAENPDEAVRLRSEINKQLQDHVRIIEGFLQINGENRPLQERLQEMLQTNTQTRLRINEEEIVVDPVITPEPTLEVIGTPEVVPAGEIQNQNQNQNRVQNIPDEYLEDSALKFQFRFDQDLEGDVYAEVAGTRYDCMVDGNLVTCDLTGVPGIGKLSLYQHNSNLLLYSYNYDHEYDYLWEGIKESGGSQTQEQGNPDTGNGSPENGQNGKK